MKRKETQNVEFKQSWRDEFLKEICGFANAKGGTLLVGVDDSGKAVGVENGKRLLEDIPNKIVSLLGIVPDVNLVDKNGVEIIEIVVSPSSVPILYHGVCYYRSGTTKQELSGVALQQFILKKVYPMPTFTEEDYKEAERALRGKSSGSNRNYDTGKKYRSLHNIDADDE